MEKLIDIKAPPVSDMLTYLLQDKTTKKNIIWATDSYTENGNMIDPKSEITATSLYGFASDIIQPRVLKSMEEQSSRTKKNAEVFTPCWVVNKMNNHLDEEWFGRPDVFNKEDGNTWIVNEENIVFPEGKTWKDYVESTRLEITCGEAPYLVSRYDTTTGEYIPVQRRIGLLDRKLRVVNENTDDEDTWLKWAEKAFQSVYGYEWQGDNLLIARINMLMTFVEYMEERWGHLPTKRDLKKLTNIIVWNIWQMDGLKGTLPFGEAKENEQLEMDLFGSIEESENDITEPCRIYDWKGKRSVIFNSMKGYNNEI